ncbi:pentapeptide repeat-containing protein [Thiotrichales bacterium 19X7-9]|nr:pentapeptide repeat-containing protein [Thiotrichales bacterium 19X7-9]
MKKIKPPNLYFMRKVTWDKPIFRLHTTIYAGFNYDKQTDQWLDKKALLTLIKKIQASALFDHGVQRKYSECLIYCENNPTEDIGLQIGDINKTDAKKTFLALPLTDKHYRKTKGTFNDEWLKNNWPSLPKDHQQETFQIAPKDQWSKTPFRWNEAFKIIDQSTSEDENTTYSLPFKRIELFVEKKDQLHQVKLQPDLIWLLPEYQTGIVVAHGTIEVKDQLASDIDYFYITDPTLDETISLEEHKNEFLKQKALKKPNFKPKPMQIKKPQIPSEISIDKPQPKPIELDPEIENIKADIDQKVATLKSQYASQIQQAQSQQLPSELENALNESNPKMMINKIKTYVDSKLQAVQNQITEHLPDKKGLTLNPSDITLDSMLLSLSTSLTNSFNQAKALLPKSEIDKLPNPESLLKEVTQQIKTAEEEKANKVKPQAKKITKIHFQNGDFSNENFSNYDFTDCDLTNSIFKGANLTNALFKRTIIKNTNFEDANLNASIFKNLQVDSSNFKNTLLSESQFDQTIINHSLFEQTDLSKSTSISSQWRNCQFKKVRFNHSTLEKVEFNHCNMGDIYFSQSQLTKVDFNNIHAKSCYFDQLNANDFKINHSTIEHCYAQESKLISTKLIRSQLSFASFESAKACELLLNQCQLKEVNFSNSDLAGIRIQNESNIDQCLFNHANLTKARMMKSHLYNNQFNQSILNGAMIYQCTIKMQKFNKVVAKNSNFNGSNLTACFFEKTNLLNAKFRFVNLNQSTYSQSNLYGISLYQAKMNDTLFENNLTKDNFDLIKSVQTQEVQ